MRMLTYLSVESLPSTVNAQRTRRKSSGARKLPTPGQRKLPSPPKVRLDVLADGCTHSNLNVQKKLPSAPTSKAQRVSQKLMRGSSRKKRTTPAEARALQAAEKHRLKGFTVRAVHNCDAEDPTELSFKKGDLITDGLSRACNINSPCAVDDTTEEGWMVGTVLGTGAQGLFPVNYVEYLPDLNQGLLET